MLSLGRTPLANALSTGGPSRLEPTYPLELEFCRGCTLVQITETVPAETLFSEYVYFSSYSDTVVEHARRNVARLIDARRLDGSSLVVEIASNDGYLLQFYRQRGIAVIGVEPAQNVARVAETERGIPTIREFFSCPLAERLVAERGRADVVHANNVLAHVADLNGFVQGISVLLKDSGCAVIEAPYVKDMIERLEFDTIYHEHLCYFSLTALQRLFARHGLAITDVERLAIHGGSLRVYVQRKPAPRASRAVTSLLASEEEQGMHRLEYYRGFAGRVHRLRDALRLLLGTLKADGKKLAAYGASAKGSTLLNFAGIGRETLDFVADRSHVKQGRFTPGTGLPIVGPEALCDRMPDYVLLLSWNLKDEVLSQQAAYRARGGRFIIPVPQPEIV